MCLRNLRGNDKHKGSESYKSFVDYFNVYWNRNNMQYKRTLRLGVDDEDDNEDDNDDDDDNDYLLLCYTVKVDKNSNDNVININH